MQNHKRIINIHWVKCITYTITCPTRDGHTKYITTSYRKVTIFNCTKTLLCKIINPYKSNKNYLNRLKRCSSILKTMRMIFCILIVDVTKTNWGFPSTLQRDTKKNVKNLKLPMSLNAIERQQNEMLNKSWVFIIK